MEFDVKQLSVHEIYLRMVQLITPRPIAWVSTRSQDGIDNLAPFSFFSGVGANPPTICFAPANNAQGEPKDTLRNIQQTGQFIVNVVSPDLAAAMHRSGDPEPPEVSEFAQCGVAAVEGTQVTVPRVAQAQAAMECTLHSVVQLGTGPGGANLVIGNVIYFHCDDDCLDQAAMQNVARVGRKQYGMVDEPFTL